MMIHQCQIRPNCLAKQHALLTAKDGDARHWNRDLHGPEVSEAGDFVWWPWQGVPWFSMLSPMSACPAPAGGAEEAHFFQRCIRKGLGILQALSKWIDELHGGRKMVSAIRWKIRIFHGKIHYFDWDMFNSYVANYQRVSYILPNHIHHIIPLFTIVNPLLNY